MPYSMWYVTHSAKVPLFAEMAEWIDDAEFDADLRVVKGPKTAWERVNLVGHDNLFAVEITRTAVRFGHARDAGAKIVRSFLQQIEDVKPVSAIRWLRNYLQRTRTIYSLRLHGDYEEWSEPVDELRRFIDDVDDDVDALIAYRELEGWSNDMGEHITWEFSAGDTGVWWMGLLIDGKWHRFQMEIGDKQNRESFRHGRVPPGIKSKQR